MLDVNSLSTDCFSDTVWVDLLPWLDDYVSDRAASLERLGTDEWWLEDSPRISAVGGDLEKLLDDLAELFVANHKPLSMAAAFPSITPDLPISALRLDARAATLAGRLTNDKTVLKLLELTARDAFLIKGTSESTVRGLVVGLLRCSVVRDPTELGDSDSGAAENPVLVQLTDDLAELGYWLRARGMSDQPLLTVSVEDEAPVQVQEIAARIGAVTALDVSEPGPTDAVDEIENLIEQLDQRELVILRERLMAVDRQTLGFLAAKLNVSAGRVSQLESALKSRFTAFCGYGTATGNLLASMRVEIQPVASLDRLLGLHPIISSVVPTLGVPLWLVLDRLDDYFDVKDGWAAAPDVAAAKRRTLSLLEDLESENGVVDLDQATGTLSMDRDEFESWLEWCEIPVVSGCALMRTRRIADHVIGALEAGGSPSTADELRELVDPGRTVDAVERALNSDDRVRRDGSGKWHLAEWAVAIDSADDVPLIEATFEKDEHGVVRRRNSGRVKSPDRTRRLHRIGIGWRYRVVVTADHLRGSGFSVPAGVATAVGCGRGQTVELASRLGDQAIRWTTAQPTIGSIRRFLTELPVQVGDSVFLDFAGSGFDVAPAVVVPADADPLRRALSLIGHTEPMSIAEGHLIRVLADAIGLSGETRPRRLLGAYEAGSEEAVVDLLEQAWMHGSPLVVGQE